METEPNDLQQFGQEPGSTGVSFFGIIPLLGLATFYFFWSSKVLYPLVPKLFGLTHVDMSKLKTITTISLEGYYDKKTVLPNEYTPMVYIAKLVFSIVVSASLMVISLVLFEIQGFFDLDSKIVIWKFSLPLLVFFLIFVVPMLFVYHLINNWELRREFKFNSNIKAVLLMAITVIWLLALQFLKKAFFWIDDSGEGYLVRFLNQLALLGIMSLGALSGIISVSTPYNAYRKDQQYISVLDLKNKARQLESIQDQLNTKLSRLETKPKASRFRLFSFSSNDSNYSRIEVESLTSMRDSLKQELHQLYEKYQVQKNKDSFLGKIGIMWTKVFSIYCVYKFTSVLLYKIPVSYYKTYSRPSDEEPNVASDALSATLSKLIVSLNISSFQPDEKELTNQITFLLSLGLFASSISSLHSTFHSIKKALPSHLSVSVSSPDSTNNKSVFRSLFISETLGIYTISTLVLLKTNIPESLSKSFVSFLGKSSYFNGARVDFLFDKVFATSCTVSLVILLLSSFFGNEDEIYDEEILLEKEL
ncbi:Putative G-protein coupled receptor [Komagataella phaffii CBS 7435]|uniref:Golgi pH regulator n=2 Tax=Komagataella phaffii TaxID=460519 RepID=C4R4J1_KOMPG|nr:Hypothetical protein PAS_chr3_0427 [Komagataella phaffii GS115]AOA63675.1 GQ67_03497T0 [Komagataella phaffii]CAH2449768.1 Putative G-protein coupled receptor [Komagataella phaffii CBS 7435]AOA69153.1 GQ68_03467T0 [Komagataella phaffii GS115]CAY70477.1 Hypothetical protein PAS_chr3_0427 [Komagataella phaffii GS115]CCA39739.1 Putative G-protein coupled receptor [Komagataella phaffii CBS 7435]